MTTGRTKGMTDRAAGSVVLVAAQRDDGSGDPTEEYLLLRVDEFGQLLTTSEGAAMTTGRTKGITKRAVGNVVLVAAQRDDADGNPTEEYLLLRADENGRLRTTDPDAVSVFLGLTDTPGSYSGQGLLVVRVNAAEDALEFAAGGGAAVFPQMDDVGGSTFNIPGWTFEQAFGSPPELDTLFYVPIYVERSRTFTEIGVHVTVAGGGGTVARLGIYAATFDGSGDMTPDTLTLDAGVVSVATTGQKSIAISQTLAEGFHFLAYSHDGTPTLIVPDAANAVTVPVTARASVINSGQSPALSVAVVDGAAALPGPATAPTTFRPISRCAIFIGE